MHRFATALRLQLPQHTCARDGCDVTFIPYRQKRYCSGTCKHSAAGRRWLDRRIGTAATCPDCSTPFRRTGPEQTLCPGCWYDHRADVGRENIAAVNR